MNLIPFRGNGDVNTPADALRMFQETGCAGVMIGRAALTNPWIFRQILDPGLVVTEAERIELCISFFQLLLDLLEPREALHKMKKIGCWFTKGIMGGVAFRQKLQTLNDHEAIIAQLRALNG